MLKKMGFCFMNQKKRGAFNYSDCRASATRALGYFWPSLLCCLNVIYNLANE